jgi:hypothetical protein
VTSRGVALASLFEGVIMNFKQPVRTDSTGPRS